MGHPGDIRPSEVRRVREDYTCCAGNPEDGHEMGCPNDDLGDEDE